MEVEEAEVVEEVMWSGGAIRHTLDGSKIVGIFEIGYVEILTHVNNIKR